MTGRHCLEAILDHQTPPRLCWTTLVDDLTRSVMPDEARSLPPLDFNRAIGCDILQFGNYGLPAELQVLPPWRRVEPETQVEHTIDPDGTQRTTVRSEWGALTSCTRNSHPTRYPIETLEELRTARRIWEQTRFEEAEGHEESFARTDAAIGDSGLYAYTTSPSPVQQLLEVDMGMIAFYGMLQDYPREVEGLLAVMHEARKQEYELTARRTPARVVIPVENTSSTLISPTLYRRYSLPQLRDYVDILHRYGKLAVLHMCGLLTHLLPVIRETGLDGINAATAPPHGDTTVEDILDACGEDFIILGGIFDGSVLHASQVTRRQLHATLEALYTPRVRKAKLLLWLGVDGLPTPLERFVDVGDWYREQGERDTQ